MQKKYFLCFFLLFSIIIKAQDKAFEFGIPNTADLQMKVYPKDTTANAVVLYEYGNAFFKFNGSRISLYLEYSVRIKILKQDAIEKGNITIPLRKSQTTKRKESISKVKAISMTSASDGSIKSVALNKENIFTENYNDNYDLVKFAIPNVTVGSVIEYEYTLKSPFQFNFFPWEFQTDLPKIYSQYQTSIPANYKYNIKLIGYKPMSFTDSKIKRNCLVIDSSRSSDCTVATYIMEDIPAFIEEDYMLAAENFKSKIKYELKEYVAFNGEEENFSKTWKDVDKELRLGEGLGSQSNKSNYFKKQLSQDLFQIVDPLEKAKKIYYYLQNKMTWDKTINLFGKKDIKDTYEKTTGSITELNLVLLNSLRAAGLDANIMLLSTRDNGYTTKLYPVLTEFNYLVVKLDIDNTSFLLDATNKELAFGMLPYKCLNGYGRVFDFKKGSYWYDIVSDKYNSRNNTQIMVNVNEDGSLSGKVREINSGYFGLNKRKELMGKDEESYFEDLENYYSKTIDFEIEEFEISNKSDKEKAFMETFQFKIEEGSNSENIYFYPFMFNRFKQNPFKLKERTYPVDFGHPLSYNYQIAIEIPDSMEYVDIPKSKKIKLQDNLGELYINTIQNENKLNLVLKFNIKSSIYLAEAYPALKELFKELVFVQNKAPIAIKKKN